MTSNLKQLIQNHLWLSGEHRKVLLHMVETNHFTTEQETQLTMILKQSETQGNQLMHGFFSDYPDQLKHFAEKLKKIGHSLWKEAENFYQEHTQKNSIEQLEQELQNLN